MRIADSTLRMLIENDGETETGPVGNVGVLRLALDLQDARKELFELKKIRDLPST